MRAICTSCVDTREDVCLRLVPANSSSLGISCPIEQAGQPGQDRHHQIPREPVMGIEPMTPVLPRLCATAAPHGQEFWVGSEGFEPPKATAS